MGKTYRHIILSLLLGLFLIPSSYSQTKKVKKLYVFKGLMVDKSTSEPIPYSHVVNIDRKRGTISNENGAFALYVRPYDTLMLTSVGFITKMIVVDVSEEDLQQRVIVELEKDTISLTEVVIYGKTWEQFKKEFVELEVNSDEYIEAVNTAGEWFKEGLNKKEKEVGITMPGPVSLLYEYFNKKEVLKRRLHKNREKYGYVVPDDIL